MEEVLYFSGECTKKMWYVFAMEYYHLKDGVISEQWWHMPLTVALGQQMQMDLCEVYFVFKFMKLERIILSHVTKYKKTNKSLFNSMWILLLIQW